MGTKKTGRKHTRMNSVQEQAREQKAWELLRAGWSPKATAEYLNVSERQVRRYADAHVQMASERLADEIAGDIQIIRAHALEAAAKDDLGNRAFWWQLYIRRGHGVRTRALYPPADHHRPARSAKGLTEAELRNTAGREQELKEAFVWCLQWYLQQRDAHVDADTAANMASELLTRTRTKPKFPQF